MKQRIIVSGEDLDLTPDSLINYNIQINDISDISTRNSSYSNTVEIPKTSRNQAIFEMLGMIGSTTRVPYSKIPCKFLIDGFALIQDGYLQISSTNRDSYSIVLYSGIISLSEALGALKITDLDLSDLNHNRDKAEFLASVSYTEGYIYPPALYDEDSPYTAANSLLTMDTQYPMVFVHTIFTRILDEAGFTYSGALFTDAEFLKEVFSVEKGLDDKAVAIVLTDLMPDFTQKAFIADVLTRYAQVIRFTSTTSIELISIGDLITGSEGYGDLTNNVISLDSEKYDLNYAQNNKFTFSYIDEINTDGDGELVVNNDTLIFEKTAFTSIYDYNNLITNFNTETIYHINLVELTIENSLQVVTGITKKSGLYKLAPIPSYSIRVRGTTIDSITTTTITVPFVDTANVSMAYYLTNNYSEFSTLLDSFKIVSGTFKLNSIELSNIDLFKVYYLKQTGKYYYINRIKTKGVVAKMELVELPNPL